MMNFQFFFQILLGMAIGIIVFVAVIITCCIAGCLTILPYIGTVVLLPVLAFKRSYSLYFLAQSDRAMMYSRAVSDGIKATTGEIINGLFPD